MFRRIIQTLILNILRLLTNWFIDVTVIGAENIPQKGPTLVVMNHFAIFDIPVITVHIAPKTPTFFTASALQNEAYIRPILWAFRDNYIIVNRGQIDRAILRNGLAALSRDEFVVIMPEGGVDEILMPLSIAGVPQGLWPAASNSRKNGQLMQGRAGAALFATKADVPILPLGAVGIDKVEGNLMKFKRTKVTVRVGEPFKLDSIEGLRGQARKQRLETDTDLIMRKIAALVPPEVRGMYGEEKG